MCIEHWIWISIYGQLPLENIFKQTINCPVTFHRQLVYNQWCDRVMLFESRAKSSYKPVESDSSQSHPKYFRVRVESWLGRVKVVSQKLPSHFESLVCKLESMSSQINLNIFLLLFLFLNAKMFTPQLTEKVFQTLLNRLKFKNIIDLLGPNCSK